MRLRALAVALVFASASAVHAQPPEVADPDVRKGIALVDEGEYDSAILTLDGAVRRLAADKGHSTRDLAEAYFYLGVAYLGKGHETTARARFREAVRQMRDMSPSPEKFPPRVIELFEKAREESKADAPAAAGPEKKGGGRKALLLVGGLAVAGGGAALALKGGGDEGNDSDAPSQFVGIGQPFALTGSLSRVADALHFDFQVVGSGTLTAELTWTGPGLLYLDFSGPVAASTRGGPTVARIVSPITAGWYNMGIHHESNSGGDATTYRLDVRLE